ncbi:MAG TPA: ABC transporter permease [Burkholderiales bacterium]|nr:ABC transporter permease [Burkholderiales bacterium]
MASLALHEADGGATIALAGRLDAYSVGPLWSAARAALSSHPSARLVVDCRAVDYCDGAGVALLLDMLRQPRPAGADVRIEGLAERFRSLLDQFDPKSFAGGPAERPRRPFIERVGLAGVAFWADLRGLIAFLGEATAALAYAARHPHMLRWRDIFYVAEEAGVNALPIVALIGFLMGVILAFQSAIAMEQFGAEIFVANLLALSILRELGPLMTAILLAGRSGAAFAAEIGTMKVNQEIDALTTMGLDPVKFLVVTRVLAATAMTVPLVVFADLIGLVGGALVMLTFEIPIATYYKQAMSFASLGDFMGGLVKSLVFGVLIAGIGCLRGLQTETGASAVGISATSAVVSGIVLIVFVDGVFAVLFYYLGI